MFKLLQAMLTDKIYQSLIFTNMKLLECNTTFQFKVRHFKTELAVAQNKLARF